MASITSTAGHAATPFDVLHWHDLTHLGWPLDPETLAELREEQPAAASTRRYFTESR